VAPKVRHGRRKERRLWVLCDPSLNRYAGSSGDRGAPWPGLAQVCRIERRRTLWRRGRPAGETKVEVRHYITSVPPERAGAQELLRRIGGHWGIENQVHWTRDMDWDEDRSQVRSGAAPQVLAACHNLAPSLLRRQRCVNIAAALRTNAGRPGCAVQLVLTGGLR
jgi:predicted transposase YbfD/YdcC